MVTNIHERLFPNHSEAELGAMVDTLGQPHDKLWPRSTGNFPAMKLDGPLRDLPAGGHGLVRYHTTSYEPGQSVTWRFEKELGLDGIHRAEVVPAVSDAGPGLRHTIEGRTRGAMRVLWPVAVRWLHDAAIEELFDQAEASLEDRPVVLRKHSLWVRFLLKVAPSPRKEEELWAKQAV